MTYEEWKEKLTRLDNYINSLTTWNGYAERCQRDYDNLLKQDPRLKENNEER